MGGTGLTPSVDTRGREAAPGGGGGGTGRGACMRFAGGDVGTGGGGLARGSSAKVLSSKLDSLAWDLRAFLWPAPDAMSVS
jgi:hypothetical protein